MRRKSMKKGTSDMVMSLVAGAVAGVAAQAADKYFLSTVDPLYSGIGMAAVGAALPMFLDVKGTPEVGAGLIALGAERIAGKYMGGASLSGIAYQRPRYKFIGSPQRNATEFLSAPGATVSGAKKKGSMKVVD